MTRRRNMPVVARRGKIKVLIYYSDHAPPHVHVDAAGDAQVVVLIRSPSIPSWIMSKAERQIVLAWIRAHEEELLVEWDHAEVGEEIEWIGGL